MNTLKIVLTAVCSCLLLLSSCASAQLSGDTEEPAGSVVTETQSGGPGSMEDITEEPDEETAQNIIPEEQPVGKPVGVPEESSAGAYIPGTYKAVIYRSESVEVVLLDDPAGPRYVSAEWALPSLERSFTLNTVIMSGVASNVRQAAVTHSGGGRVSTSNITIFDIEISDVQSCRSGSFNRGDTVTVGTGYNMYNYSEGMPVIAEGNSYLFFCYPSYENRDSMQLEQYVDCWIWYSAYLLLEKVGDYYLIYDYLFQDIPGAVKLTDCFDFTEKQLDDLQRFEYKDKTDVMTYIDRELSSCIHPEIPEAADALCVLKTRTCPGSADFSIHTLHSYLIRCADFEKYVRNTAEEYNG